MCFFTDINVVTVCRNPHMYHKVLTIFFLLFQIILCFYRIYAVYAVYAVKNDEILEFFWWVERIILFIHISYKIAVKTALIISIHRFVVSVSVIAVI